MIRIFKNISSLSLVQLSNYLIPLITFPYLTRILGPVNYGLANLVLVFSSYFILFVQFGFHISSVKEISVFRNNPKQVRNIFWSTLYIKLIIFVLILPIYFGLLLSIDVLYENLAIFIMALLFVLGNILNPFWVFQGFEDLTVPGWITAGFKSFSALLIFTFVLNPTDIFQYVTILSLINFLTAIVLFSIVVLKYRLKIVISTKFQLILRFKRGYDIFISNIYVFFYTSFNILILGFFLGNYTLGIYSTANRIREFSQEFIVNVDRAVFPFMSGLFFSTSKNKLKIFNKTMVLINMFGLLLSCVLYFFSDLIIQILAGDQYTNSVKILEILSFIPFFMSISTVLGIQLMINLGLTKEFKRILGSAVVMNFTILFFLLNEYGSVGVAMTALLVEGFISLRMIILVYKNKLFNKLIS